MSRIPREVRYLRADECPKRLVVLTLDHVAIGIRFGYDRSKNVRMEVSDRLTEYG